MILAYVTTHFMTLMLMSALIVMMVVNRKLKIPGTQLFYALIAVVLLLSVLDFFEDFLAGDFDVQPSFNPVIPRTFAIGLIYILRPVVILIELLVIIPKPKYKLLCSVPAIINTAIYLTAFFGSKIAFYVDSDGWHRGPLGKSVFAAQVLYVILLAAFSLASFGRGNLKRGIILMMIVLMAVVTTVLELENIVTGQSTVVAAFCVLLYYIYLASIYQQEIHELFEEKELHIAQQELLLLRSQIHSDFIFDSLSVIRSLAKTDKKASAAAIDNFSLYLRAHINALRDDKPTSLQWELDCVKAYLALIQISGKKPVDLACDLQVKEFELPALLLESVAEYCISGNSRSNETLTIKTRENNEEIKMNISISSADEQTAEAKSISDSILDDARRRLNMQCGGTLHTDGTSVNIAIPKQQT